VLPERYFTGRDNHIVKSLCRIIKLFGLQLNYGSCHAAVMATKSTKNPAAVALGRLGGLKGGPALAAKMTPAQRRAAGRKAALARWSKKPK
jgi:hypothetical protein